MVSRVTSPSRRGREVLDEIATRASMPKDKGMGDTEDTPLKLHEFKP